MIAIDTNLLVYSHRQDSDFHERARAVVEDLASGDATWGLPWAVAHEFVVAVTRRRAKPTPLADALNVVTSLTASPRCVPLAEPLDHWSRLRSLAESAGAKGPIFYDARIAAICLAHGVRELWSADRDFGRFPQLKVRNPLVG